MCLLCCFQLLPRDVAGTNLAPVSCTTVDILYSDDGSTFVTTFASSVANDGRQTISVPTNTTSSARVMVSCANNVFYAVSDRDFRVSSSAPNSSAPDSSSGGGSGGGALGFPLIALLMVLLFRGKKRVMLI